MLCDRQNEALVNPSDESFRIAAEALDRWNHLATTEEKFYKQKSCVKWLEVEERNTPFFHLEMPGIQSSLFSRVPGKSSQMQLLTKRRLIISSASCRHSHIHHRSPWKRCKSSWVIAAQIVKLWIWSPLSQPLKSYALSRHYLTARSLVRGPDGFIKEFFVAAWPVLGADFS